MSYKIYKNFRYYLLAYLFFTTISSILLLKENYLLETNNSMAEWFINYQGGFGRRGFFGEIFLFISDVTGIYLKNVILIFLIFLIFFYHSLLFFYLKNIKFNFNLIIIIFSPLFFIFPVAELEALGRKDILILLMFLTISILFNKLNIYQLTTLLLISYTAIILSHEVSIFYLPFFYFFILFKIKKINFLTIIILIFISIYFLSIIYLLIQVNYTGVNIEKMCDLLVNNYDTKCGLGAYVLDRSLKENISELGSINFYDVLRGFWILFLGFIGVILILPNSYFTFKSGISQNILLIFTLLFIPTLIPFFIAVDWGRWFNLSYSMIVLFYFFCLKNKIILINYKTYTNFLNLVFNNKFLLSIFFIIFCLSWNPKAIHSDDLGSVPIYRIVNKIMKSYF